MRLSRWELGAFRQALAWPGAHAPGKPVRPMIHSMEIHKEPPVHMNFATLPLHHHLGLVWPLWLEFRICLHQALICRSSDSVTWQL